MSEERQALMWMGGSDTGISSLAIVSAALGVDHRSDSPPYDPADLGRCLRMIQVMPWAARGLSVLRQENAQWGRLVDRWDELRGLMDIEVGIDWSKGDTAPNTYIRMKELLDWKVGE